MCKRFMDVYTDDGIYKLIIDDESGELDSIVNSTINDLNALGVPWHGWTPYDDHRSDASIIVFGADISIKSVKIYEESETVAETATTETVTTTEPVATDIIITFLGNNHVVACWKQYHDDAVCFDLLPYAVDGVPAPNAMSAKNLYMCLSTHLAENRIPTSDYRLIITDVPLDRETAKEYIKSCSKSTTQHTTTGKAKPWHGWHDEADNADEG